MYDRDNDELLRLLAEEPWPEHALQLIGDGLYDALGNGVRAAEGPARRCAAALRERDWEGDDDLADTLEGELGSGPASLLLPLPVDLEDVSIGLDGGGFTDGGRIDLSTGEFWPHTDSGYSGFEDEDAEERDWLWVEGRGSHDGYRDMEVFIAGIEDAVIADLLEVAIQGGGAFRRFKDTIGRWPDLSEAWFAFSDDRQRGRARAWLADRGYTPTLRLTRTGRPAP